MRIRTVKPDFWKSESNGKLSLNARLLFIGLFNHADDEGRFRASPALIRAELFPYDDIALSAITGLMKELFDNGRKIIIYSGNDGDQYGFIPSFKDHQLVNRPQASKLPKPPDNPPIHGMFSECSVNDHGAFTAVLEGKGMEGIGLEGVLDASGGSPPAASASTEKAVKRIKMATDEEWLATVRETYAAIGVNVDVEMAKAKGWLLTPKGRGKSLTQRFFIGWLNRADRTVGDRALNENETSAYEPRRPRLNLSGLS
jgi:hypothetical protein